MLTYSLEERDGLPLYEYLYRRIRQDILEGTLAAGERLPSKRALAEHLRISVVTVENAYQQLEAEGFLLAKAQITHSYPHCWRGIRPMPRRKRRRSLPGGWI